MFVPLLQQSPPARWERHKGGMMSKGDERRVLRTGGRKFGWLSRDGSLSFPSSIYFLAILSVSHLSDSDSRFFCSFGCFTSSENRWKASAPIEGKEDCEVLTTMGLIHQACVCTNLCYFTSRCMPSMPPNFLICFANKCSVS